MGDSIINWVSVFIRFLTSLLQENYNYGCRRGQNGQSFCRKDYERKNKGFDSKEHDDLSEDDLKTLSSLSLLDTSEPKLVSLPISNEDKNGLSETSPVLLLRVPTNPLKKKLLVLDLNGLLVDVVSNPPKGCRPDTRIRRQAIFKRPFYLDFLEFCFERFEVGLWSSRTKRNFDSIVDYLVGDLKHKFLFCWDLSHCTSTKFKTLENKHKPLVFKELRKLWEKSDPNLPWEMGYYNKSNTLLLDDSPYKSLLNPANTAIFPYPYQYHNQADNALGNGGALRAYLEEMAETDNMQSFVEHHSICQKPITEQSETWGFYQEVLCTFSPSLK